MILSNIHARSTNDGTNNVKGLFNSLWSRRKHHT